MKKLIIVVVIASMILSACGGSSNPTQGELPRTEEIGQEEPSFKEECEKNAQKLPAGVGAKLFTKGDTSVTGMKYYFKGKLKAIGSADQFEGKTVWLLKNEDGYVLPVEMLDGENANIDDEIEIWGTLSGDGYQLPNVDNVVGVTGYLIMVQYSVNGENKI